eukprot:1156582-Pelagomonas_calceolata.AAC.1
MASTSFFKRRIKPSRTACTDSVLNQQDLRWNAQIKYVGVRLNVYVLRVKSPFRNIPPKTSSRETLLCCLGHFLRAGCILGSTYFLGVSKSGAYLPRCSVRKALTFLNLFKCITALRVDVSLFPLLISGAFSQLA